MEENKVIEQEVVKEQPEVASKEEGTTERRPFRGNRNSKGGKKFDRKNNGSKERREKPEKEYEERVVFINRVSKTVKGGRRMKMTALVVVGNKKGKYGYGLGKSNEVPDAIRKAVDKAKRDVNTVKIVKNGTLAHSVIGEFGATKVFLKPAPEGTGIIAGSTVRAILELAGIRNVYSKVYGSRTPINACKATVNALNNLKSYKSVMELRKGGSSDVK